MRTVAALLAVFALFVPRSYAGAGPGGRFECGLEAAALKAPAATPNPFPGIVPNAGLGERDFAGGGLLIAIDPSMYQITADPYAVVQRAARNWEIPGTIIKFRFSGDGDANVIKAAPVRQQAYATVGKVGLGESGALKMTIKTPYHDGDERLESIITHELGHWLGFDHSFLMETVMSPILNDRINWVDPDQVAKAVLRYGVGEHAVGTVRGRVTRRGEGLSGARINLIGEDHRTAFGTFASADGTYSVPAYSGTYRLFVDPNDGPAVKGNFIGIYPGGPLDFVTVEAPSPVRVSAGETQVADVAVPEGDHEFRISTIEPRTASPGAGAQQVKIYFAGATAEEIAGVEPLADDLRVTYTNITGEIMTLMVDVDPGAPAGPRAFMLRKTNGAIAIVPGAMGVVVPLRLTAPHYTQRIEAGAPVHVAWEGSVENETVSSYVVSASVDGGRTWSAVGTAPAAQPWYDWDPRGVVSPALRLRVDAMTADGRRVATDASIFNIGLGVPAAAGVTPGGPDAGPPAVRVLSPNGGELAAAGEPLRVTWEASDDVGIDEQTVDVSADGGATWQRLGAAGPLARSADLPVPAAMRGAALVRVTARDAAGNSATDASDAAFSVRERPLVARATAKTTAAGVTVKLTGSGFAAGAVVRINGEAAGVAPRLAASGRKLTLKGDSASLHLNPAGQENTAVVEVGGLASAPVTFVLN